MKTLIATVLIGLAVSVVGPVEAGDEPITVTILYDNLAFAEEARADWGYACLIEGTEKTILFDTGTKPEVFFSNVDALDVDLAKVDLVVISHEHGDHTGSLARVLAENHGLTVYHPVSFSDGFVSSVEQAGSTSIKVTEPVEIVDDVYLTGEMGGEIKEQSLILRTGEGLVVITGCSHPGIVEILEKTKEILDEDIFMAFGGFHMLQYSDEETAAVVERVEDLGVKRCGAGHCTGEEQIAAFEAAYGDDFVPIGAGRVLSFTAPE